jgi:predicted LPLAT superfamily acyltransferase
MPSWQGKSRGNKTGFRIFVWVLKHAGLPAAYLLLRFVAFYFFLFSGKAFTHQFYFFHRRLKFSSWKSFFSIYQNYFWFGQTIIDKIVFTSGMKHRFQFEFEGEENLRQMVDQRKGGLLLSSHIGNWEIAAYLLDRLGTDMHVVMYDAEHEQIRSYLETVTKKNPVHIILIRDDLSHIYAIQEALGKNAFVCMHADRFLEGNRTVTGELLNETARFPAGPFLLARAFQSPVSFVFAMKDRNMFYHFYAGKPKIYSGSGEDVLEEMLGEYCQSLEKTIRKYPLQWYNYYEFWEVEYRTRR